MRANRRRHRCHDFLATPDAIRAICNSLRLRLPAVIPKQETEFRRFLFAVRHIERHPATDTKRGRPGRWERQDLVKAASVLRSILERETQGRVSLSSFIAQYLPVLDFPLDVLDALSSDEINLPEAAQLARLTPLRLDCTTAQARSLRRKILQSHLKFHGSQNALRQRVKEILGEVATVSSENMTTIVQKVDAMLEIDPEDKRHLFYEEMKRLFYAMREIEPEDVDEVALERFMAAADELSNVIYSIELKRRARIRTSQKFIV
ncbi:MAG: hypothetical protein MSG64_13355 [Pyrinomonadaceae bacterium MAG19_C2-C3]|nr:hypothetical protein [Pyrinomonadaceae bacterium MAG19_C2-C3]